VSPLAQVDGDNHVFSRCSQGAFVVAGAQTARHVYKTDIAPLIGEVLTNGRTLREPPASTIAAASPPRPTPPPAVRDFGREAGPVGGEDREPPEFPLRAREFGSRAALSQS